MTSLFEGFPMTLIEAQQFGSATIAYNSFAPLSEVIIDGRNGVTVENGDQGAFASELLSLMEDQEQLKNYGKMALIDCQHYSQERVCNLWKEYLTKLID